MSISSANLIILPYAFLFVSVLSPSSFSQVTELLQYVSSQVLFLQYIKLLLLFKSFLSPPSFFFLLLKSIQPRFLSASNLFLSLFSSSFYVSSLLLSFQTGSVACWISKSSLFLLFSSSSSSISSSTKISMDSRREYSTLSVLVSVSLLLWRCQKTTSIHLVF